MWIFIAAGVSDFLDGYLARAWEQQSAIGRMLDPIADKLIVAAALLMLAADGTIAGWSLWAGVIILCREILVSGLREFLGTLAVSVPVTRARQMEDRGADGRDRLSARRQRRRQDLALHDIVRADAAVDRRDLHPLYRLRLSPRRGRPRHDRRGLSMIRKSGNRFSDKICATKRLAMRLLYFAWVKEKVGKAAEDIALPR